MSQALNDFAVTQKWPAQHPERLQLYSLPTPNGVKVSIMLEEIGLPYDAHTVSFERQDQMSAEFLSLNPNNKIPAILDPNGPNGQALQLFESGAILWYLAEKTGQLIPQDGARRYECMQWLFFQVGGVGPMMGQVGFFYKYAGKDFEDKRPLERYVAESKRLLGVIDQHLRGKQWMMGDEYTVADIAILPWLRTINEYYEAGHLVNFNSYAEINRVLANWLKRPAVQKGLETPPRA